MTKDEALKLALEALEKSHTCPLLPDDCAEAITAIKEALTQQNEFNPDWDEKLALTEEVIRLSKRIEKLEAQPEQHQDWCASLTQMLMSMPPKPSPCNCKPPQRTWVGLTDEDLANCFTTEEYETARYWESKLKEKNT